MTLLLLLQARGRMTAAELAEELEVSTRTIYRDLEALSSAGVPVYAEAGPGGGCQLIDGYRTRLTGLTAKEAEALFAAGVPGPVGDLGLGTVLGAAQLKLLAALPKELADRATNAQQRFHLDAPSWFKRGRNDPNLAVLASAVWEDRCVDIRYRHPGSDHASERHLEPLGLVLKAGVWYLVARRDGEFRTYRVSRIEALSVSDERFDRPEAFDLGAHWDASVSAYEAGAPTFEVELRVTDLGLRRLRGLERSGNRAFRSCDDPDADGWCRCTVAFESMDDACDDLRMLGADVEVLGPEPLRMQMASMAASLASLYA